MTEHGGDRRLTSDAWRRIGAVLDRVSALDPTDQSEALREACRAEGLSPEDVEPYLSAEGSGALLPEQLDPVTLAAALRAFVREGPADRLAPGTRVASYEVLDEVGAGGMGEVYRARDTRLDRTVALKRLNADVASRPDGRRRFEREARAISRLNHPHICTLFDVIEQDGAEFLVMEYVEGESLATRLERGPLTVTETVRLSGQMCDALAAAHRHNVVHRDLKPANVMLTPRGVKLLDFGLAALLDPEAGLRDPHVTATGVVMGTPAYMVPEQLQGRDVDMRADIFALGAVMHEMLTGRRAFAGESSAEIAAAILERDPEPLSNVRDDVPEGIASAIRTCLAKSADERWQSAADLARHLNWISTTGGVAPAAAGDTPRVPTGPRWLAGMVLVGIGVGAAGLALLTPALRRDANPAPAPRVLRFEIQPPGGNEFYRMHALSPDGTRIAFATSDAEGRRVLWTRPLDALSPQRLAGTDGAANPFWSPDGRFLAFFAGNALKKIELATGTVETICNCGTGTGGGGTWNRHGDIVFSKGLVVSPLWRVPASGGEAVPLAPFDPNAEPDIESIASNAWPQFLPDGKRFLWHTGARTAPGLFAGTLDSPDRVPIIAETPRRSRTAGTRGWFSGGYLFFVRDRELMAQPFSVERLRLEGEAVRLVQAVEQTAPGRSFFDVAPGVLSYQGQREARTVVRLVWFDETGREIGTMGAPNSFVGLSLSRGGRGLLVGTTTAGVVRVDTTTGIPTPLGLRGQSPVLSADSRHVALAGGATAGPFPAIASLATPEDVQALGMPRTGQAWPTDWSRDGRFLVGHALHAETGLDLWAVDMTNPGSTRYLQRVAGDQQDQRISPDGRWLAFASNERSSTFEVYVRAFPEGPGLWRVSDAGGRLPTWAADGRALFYVAPDGALMRSAIRPGTDFSFGRPTALLRQSALRWLFHRDAQFGRLYDVDERGRVLVGVPVSDPPPAPIVVLLNWELLLGRPRSR